MVVDETFCEKVESGVEVIDTLINVMIHPTIGGFSSIAPSFL